MRRFEVFLAGSLFAEIDGKLIIVGKAVLVNLRPITLPNLLDYGFSTELAFVLTRIILVS